MILVTGGAGFIGSHVAEALRARNVDVRVLDNFDTGDPRNLAHLNGIDLIEGDLREPGDVDLAVKGVQSVIHLGAIASVPKSVHDPVGTHAVNFGGTLNVVEAMRRHGVSRIVFASTAALYTPFSDLPHREDEYPDPSTPYGADKLASEFILRSYARLHGLRPTALRFFNIYGERQDPSSAYSGVISIFADRLRRGQPITIHGDGGQTRDFVYVRDLANLIADVVNDPNAPDLMNIATGQSTDLNTLVQELEAAIGTSAQVTHGPAREGDIRISLADNRRLRAYTPREWTPVGQGLARLVESLRDEGPA